MIKRLKKIALATMLLGSSAYLMAGCPFNIIDPEINPKPLTYLSTGNVSFSILEDRGVVIPEKDSYGDPTCIFDIDLTYVMLENNDTVNITGPALEYFDVEYNRTQRKLHFTQNKDIPADTYAKAIVGVDVTEESTNTQKYNGFQINVYASEIEGNQYTYTVREVLPPEVLLVDSTDVNESDPTTVLTNDTTPEINGTCDVDNTVTVQIDGVDIDPTVDCSNDGTFSITPTTPIPEGEHNITATQYYAEENTTSNPSPIDILDVDTTPPEPLTIDTVDGKTGSPVTTTDATPTIDGTCAYDDNGIVTVQIDGVDITPTAVCTPEGTYSITPDTPLEVGEHNVTATESDDAGNTKTTSAVLLTVDEPTVPEPSISTIDGNDTTGTAPTTVTTNNPNPEITGVCESGDTVTVQIDGVDIAPTVECSTDGTFIMTPTTPIVDGEHNVTVTQTNPAGETSNPSPVISIVVNSVDNTSGISGYVWFDENGNGIQDESKGNGVVEVDVILLNSSGEVIERTKTDAHGNYKLNNLVEGEDYTVKFSIPNSYNTTTKGVTNDGRDSDVNSDGSIEIINFKKGGENISMGINCDCSNGNNPEKAGASAFSLASLLVMLFMISFMAKREN